MIVRNLPSRTRLRVLIDRIRFPTRLSWLLPARPPCPRRCRGRSGSGRSAWPRRGLPPGRSFSGNDSRSYPSRCAGASWPPSSRCTRRSAAAPPVTWVAMVHVLLEPLEPPQGAGREPDRPAGLYQIGILGRFITGPINCSVSLGLLSSSVLPIPYLLGRIDDLDVFILVLLVPLLLVLLMILDWPILLLRAWVSGHVLRQCPVE